MTRTAVVGLGLIGGSIALAVNARGHDRDPNVRESARRRGLEVPDSLEDALDGAELVVAAVPTAEMPALLTEVSGLAPWAVLTDCASLKLPVVEAARELRVGTRFVAGHPMAGGRGRGIESADPSIFRGRPWALIRTARSDPTSVAVVEGLVLFLGARPIAIDAARHDRAMTWVSHLPLAVAAALARATRQADGEDLAALAGPGLLDTTRLAGQPAELALELALADPDALAGAVEAVSRELSTITASLRRGDDAALRAFFEEAEAARRSFEA